MQEHKYPIKSWAKDDQPREKLLYSGAENLSVVELLAIVITKGSREGSAVELARQVLKRGNDNLLELGKLSLRELMKIKGIGVVKAITIAAALELGRRRSESGVREKKIVRNSRDIAQFLKTRLQDNRREVFAVLFLNRANKINHFEIVSEGGLTSTIADPRIILRKALEFDAVGIILCHNHPSGSLKPSNADAALTRTMSKAAKLLEIQLLDHVIVSEAGYYSFADEGRME